DQSYFLWGIDRSVVARLLAPVGGLTKRDTRAVARGLGLVTAEKRESVEICFVPDDDYVAVLQRHLPADAAALVPGPLVTADGARTARPRPRGARACHHARAVGRPVRLSRPPARRRRHRLASPSRAVRAPGHSPVGTSRPNVLSGTPSLTPGTGLSAPPVHTSAGAVMPTHRRTWLGLAFAALVAACGESTSPPLPDSQGL